MPTLTGTGRLADDLYLLAHDDETGRPFLQPRALGVGLAGALLAELMFAGAIRIRSDRIEFTGQEPPEDRIGREVLSVLTAERDWHPVRDWLAFLAGTASHDVARRLEWAGYLTQARSRWPRRAVRWVPADPDCAFAPLIRVRAVLDPARPAAVSDAVLAGLATACGLGPRVLPYGPPGARQNLDATLRHLHSGPRELIARTSPRSTAPCCPTASDPPAPSRIRGDESRCPRPEQPAPGAMP